MSNEIITKPALVILAAGMGSRFGGPKQVASVGPSGERIIDYSIYDAINAGFNEIVFIISPDAKEVFEEEIAKNIKPHANVHYVFQDPNDLPDGYATPETREKPWGTGHAIYACRHILKGPFVIVNADDYYGVTSFKLMNDFINDQDNNFFDESSFPKHLALAGYRLANTMAEQGSVSRGVCTVDENDYLTHIIERTTIKWVDEKPAFTEDEGKTWESLKNNTTVSMNCWAFPAGVMSEFERLFEDFLRENINAPKKEFFLPFVVDSILNTGKADVKVLYTKDRWYGITYPEDQKIVSDAIDQLVENGIYPKNLWNK